MDNGKLDDNRMTIRCECDDDRCDRTMVVPILFYSHHLSREIDPLHCTLCLVALDCNGVNGEEIERYPELGLRVIKAHE